MIAYSDASVITAIVALFFLCMALVAMGRAMFSRADPPRARRFRVGVFLERDHEPVDDDERTPGGGGGTPPGDEV